MEVETWDQDFEGGFNAFAGNSVGTNLHTSISSRMSARSESLAGVDEDWNLVIDSNDEDKAIRSAQQAGVPLPSNVPTSALLGGTIKRLGKKKSRQRVNDDWDHDIEMPDSGTLQLKPRAIDPPAAVPGEEYDEFDEMEGSLGIRFAGRDAMNRSSSVSAMSPSLGSITAESDDDLRGLELPEGQMDFEALLMKKEKRRAVDAELSDLSQPSPALEQPSTVNVHKKPRPLEYGNDDFLDDFDLGAGGMLDTTKRTINRNIKIKNDTPSLPVQRAGLTLNFHDKPVDKPLRSHIPRPVSGSKPTASRLEPVFESGASSVVPGRRQATTSSAQYLRSKRSMPLLRSQQPTASSMQKHAPTINPVGGINNQPQGFSSQRAMAFHSRHDSDSRRGGAQSPPPRSQSRLSNVNVPNTPSRVARPRPNLAPSALAQEAAAKRTLTKPVRKKYFGEGNELEIFDDLQTSSAKESKFVKQPVIRAATRPGLRQTQSRGDIRDQARRNSAIPDRMVTPAPPRTPASPTKGFYDAPSNTPSYLRDTAASRIARESRLANTGTAANTNTARPRSDGPLMPLTTNWKAQVAARSPHTSPSAQRQKTLKRVQPQLIKGIGAHVAKTEKGMIYNPQTLRWEGNENTLHHFDMPPALETPTPTGHHAHSYMDHHHHRGSSRDHHAPSSSPPRPALIAHMSALSGATHGVQVNGGMVFDPRQMKWLKLKDHRDVSGPLSPSITDAEEEDAFAGIEDLKDDLFANPAGGTALLPSLGSGMASPVSLAAAGAPGTGEMFEEFDLGPKFIDSQVAEEAVWRRKCGAWFVEGEARREDPGAWRWGIREMVGREGGGNGF